MKEYGVISPVPCREFAHPGGVKLDYHSSTSHFLISRDSIITDSNLVTRHEDSNPYSYVRLLCLYIDSDQAIQPAGQPERIEIPISKGDSSRPINRPAYARLLSYVMSRMGYLTWTNRGHEGGE